MAEARPKTPSRRPVLRPMPCHLSPSPHRLLTAQPRPRLPPRHPSQRLLLRLQPILVRRLTPDPPCCARARISRASRCRASLSLTRSLTELIFAADQMRSGRTQLFEDCLDLCEVIDIVPRDLHCQFANCHSPPLGMNAVLLPLCRRELLEHL